MPLSLQEQLTELFIHAAKKEGLILTRKQREDLYDVTLAIADEMDKCGLTLTPVTSIVPINKEQNDIKPEG